MGEGACLHGRRLSARGEKGNNWESAEYGHAGTPVDGVIASCNEEMSRATSTLSLVKRTLEKAGIEFLNDDRPGVRLRGRA